MPADPAVDAAREAATVLLGARPETVERVRGAGRNSGVFRIRWSGTNYALKQYPPRLAEERDRVGTEMAALRFMAGHGIAAVPRPIAADPERGCALLEWIEGTAVVVPGDADIAAATKFLGTIHALRDAVGARMLPAAAEACLSGGEIVAQIERRLTRLGGVMNEPALTGFLDSTMRPLVVEATNWAQDGYAAAGLDFAAPVAASAQTLCPSDFGFHNALRRSSGDLAFIDFDYFGWDDPVKLTSDVLLHPGMQLSETLKRKFAGEAIGIYGGDATFPIRLPLLYPLFGLRWCMILLNEFLPERWAHRVNAGNAADWPTAKQRQLARARQWVRSLSTNYRRFPYAK